MVTVIIFIIVIIAPFNLRSHFYTSGCNSVLNIGARILNYGQKGVKPLPETLQTGNGTNERVHSVLIA